MKKKSLVLRGLAGIMALILPVSLSLTTLTFEYSGILNSWFQVDTTGIIEDEDAEGTVFYANTYGDDAKILPTVYEDTKELNIEITSEGTTLLKNENAALPLAPGSKITVFGYGAVANQVTYFTVYPDGAPESTTFMEAMNTAFGSGNINPAVTDASEKKGAELSIEEIEALSDSFAKYNDAAVFVVARSGGEGNDIAMYSATDTYEDGTPRRTLDLTSAEEEMIQYLKEQKEAGTFSRIIAIVCTEWQMELDWLDEYGIDAAILAGQNGSWGADGVARVLNGEVNPSGHLVDTYAVNSLSAPATTYAANENTQVWSNTAELCSKLPLVNDSDGENIKFYIIYAEGIYVGYKYYETRYEDAVMNRGSASSGVGTTRNSWSYEDEVTYTFGYGLSYTTFAQTLDSVSYDPDAKEYTITATVTNTGSVAGKDVVEVYAQTPYGDYERENLVEKSAVELVGYAKTRTLSPGESETVTVTVNGYLLASYDNNGAETYILSEGDYYFAIGDDAHDALNNILAAKGYSTKDGMTAEGNAALTYTWNMATLDAETYSESIYTGVEITNIFDDTDINYYGYDFTYLTRQDWAGSYPEKAVVYEANENVIRALSNYDYETPADAPDYNSITQGANNGIMLADLVTVEYDDPKWDAFIDQLTIDELCTLMTDDISAQVVSRLGITGQKRIDDDTTSGVNMRWVSTPTTARAWNNDLLGQRGYLSGTIARLNGYDELWYGTSNMHRTPYGGRANQYYSEDANLAYLMGAVEAAAVQDAGVICCVKHFCANDQESHRSGVSTFMTEQTLREVYGRAFEGSFTNGALSTMTALNRVGTRLGKNYEAMLTTLLRDEWGFKGHVTSDGYVKSGFFDNTAEEVVAGMDYSCLDSMGINATALKNSITDHQDGHLLTKARDMAKHNLYVMTRQWRINGMDSGGIVYNTVPSWQTAVLVLDCAALVLLIVFSMFTAVTVFVKNKEEQ